MSASVAMSAVGLLDRPFTPPSDYPDSRMPDWHDHMDLDRSDREQSTASRYNEPANARIRRSTGGSGAQSGDERRNVLSGLLAALATNPGEVQITTTASQTQDPDQGQDQDQDQIHDPDRHHHSVTPPQDSPISPTSAGASLAPPEESTNIDATNTNNTNTIAPAAHVNDTYLPDLQTLNSLSSLAADEMDFPILDPSSTTVLDNIPIPAFEMPTEPLLPHTPTSNSIPINIKRQYDAFARLEFDDGIFYLNTYQCELGRDQHAYHIALQREREAEEAVHKARQRPDSSRGRASQISNIIKAESQIQGSVVSEAGGFAGVDEQPVEGYGTKKNGQPGCPQGSHSSDASIVRPADVLHNPSLHAPFDYNKEASRQFAPPAPPIENLTDEDEQPAPITADHLPDPNSCPLIPIHVTSESETTELDGLKAISRRHMKILWSWEKSSFMLEVLGRNGAFLEGQFIAPSEVVPLYTGANIQISSVNFVFRLPHVEVVSPSIESMSNLDEEEEASINNLSDVSDSGPKGKLKLKLNLDPSGAQTILANGESRRRGPGRPPKDGVMSQRERKEREKADKEAKTRALNGDPSPPAPTPAPAPAPVPQRKTSKSQIPTMEQITDATKPEKRKYNKRKREDGEEEQVLPSIEAVDDVPTAEPSQILPPAKKVKSKSYSPPYKPKEECTQADLARPAHNYAVLLYQTLSETGEISLRQIYKEVQYRWPYFKHIVESDGWTSSIRHNLNQEVNKLFLKGRKEGKGFTWLAKPNALEEYHAQKNKRSNAPSAPRPKMVPPQRANYPPGANQLNWQNSGPAPQPHGTGAPPHPGQWNPQQNGHNMPGQPPINGQPQIQGQMPNQPGANPNLQNGDAPTPGHMIVTFLGVRIIDRFENTMMNQLRARFPNDEEKLSQWIAVFRSARARCLNGAPASELPQGENDDERTIMIHVNKFVDQYKNPAFRGFHAGTHSVDANPHSPSVSAPNNIAGSISTQSNGHPALAAQAGTNAHQIGTAVTTSQQGGQPSVTPTPILADSHSHPPPPTISSSTLSNAQPGQGDPRVINGNVQTIASTATPSGSAVVTAAATSSAPAPVPFKDITSTADSAVHPASSFTGPKPDPLAAINPGSANHVSPTTIPISTNTQSRSGSGVDNHIVKTSDVSRGIANDTTAIPINLESTATPSDRPRPESSPSAKPEPTSVISQVDAMKQEPATNSD